MCSAYTTHVDTKTLELIMCILIVIACSVAGNGIAKAVFGIDIIGEIIETI